MYQIKVFDENEDELRRSSEEKRTESGETSEERTIGKLLIYWKKI